MLDYFYKYHHHKLFHDLIHQHQKKLDLFHYFHRQINAIVDKQIKIEKNQLDKKKFRYQK
jgi:hypothetical protein